MTTTKHAKALELYQSKPKTPPGRPPYVPRKYSYRFSERAKNLMAKRGLEYSDLAAMMGKSTHQAGNYLRLDSSPNIDVVGEVAEFLGVPIEFLVKDDAEFPSAVQQIVEYSRNMDEKQIEMVAAMARTFSEANAREKAEKEKKAKERKEKREKTPSN